MARITEAFRAGDWQTLLALCEQEATSTEHSAAAVEFLRLYALVELGRLDAAIATLSANPGISGTRRAKAFRRVASALVETGREVEAVNLYQRAATALPTDATSRILLGALLLELGQMDKATAAFRDATRCGDGHPEEAWLNLGGIHAHRGQVADAEVCFLKALDVAPGYQEAIDALARLRTGEFDEGGT